MSICRATGFGIWRSFGGGGWIRLPRECTYAQLEVVAPQELMAIFQGSG